MKRWIGFDGVSRFSGRAGSLRAWVWVWAWIGQDYGVLRARVGIGLHDDTSGDLHIWGHMAYNGPYCSPTNDTSALSFGVTESLADIPCDWDRLSS